MAWPSLQYLFEDKGRIDTIKRQRVAPSLDVCFALNAIVSLYGLNIYCSFRIHVGFLTLFSGTRCVCEKFVDSAPEKIYEDY